MMDSHERSPGAYYLYFSPSLFFPQPWSDHFLPSFRLQRVERNLEYKNFDSTPPMFIGDNTKFLEPKFS